ncbi:hypothetical protein Tco_0066102 [Tanacetum coccineum]
MTVPGALVFEKDSEGAPINPEPPTCRRREYIPSTYPSSRFPHMNVRVFPTSQERYHEGALVFEKDSEGAPINPEPPTCRRREYIPSTDPSSRFPHMNVRVFSTSQESKKTYASCGLSDAANDEDTRGVPLEEFLADSEINNRELKDYGIKVVVYLCSISHQTLVKIFLMLSFVVILKNCLRGIERNRREKAKGRDINQFMYFFIIGTPGLYKGVRVTMVNIFKIASRINRYVLPLLEHFRIFMCTFFLNKHKAILIVIDMSIHIRHIFDAKNDKGIF